MFVYSVLSMAEWLLSSLLALVPRPRRARALRAALYIECARAISADLSPQILIYLHYFNGGIVGGCPLSRADAGTVQGLWEMSRCISASSLVQIARTQIKRQKALLRFRGFK